MAFTLSGEKIARLRAELAAAEPYGPNDPMILDGEEDITPEEIARENATRAKYLLEAAGVPLTEDK